MRERDSACAHVCVRERERGKIGSRRKSEYSARLHKQSLFVSSQIADYQDAHSGLCIMRSSDDVDTGRACPECRVSRVALALSAYVSGKEGSVRVNVHVDGWVGKRRSWGWTEEYECAWERLVSWASEEQSQLLFPLFLQPYPRDGAAALACLCQGHGLFEVKKRITCRCTVAGGCCCARGITVRFDTGLSARRVCSTATATEIRTQIELDIGNDRATCRRSSSRCGSLVYGGAVRLACG